MALSEQELMEDEPAYRKLHRICLAVCIMLAPLIVLPGFAFDPTGVCLQRLLIFASSPELADVGYGWLAVER